MDGEEQQIDGEIHNHENMLKEKKVLFHSSVHLSIIFSLFLHTHIYIYIYF